MNELKKEIISGGEPDIIAVAEIKPKNYRRQLTEVEYNIKGYHLLHANLEDKGPTRGVGIYVKDSLSYTEGNSLDIKEIKGSEPKELVSVEIKLTNNEKLILSNLYRSPNSDSQENIKINKFVELFGHQKYTHRILLGDFNRKDIEWKTITATKDDDLKFIEATRDGFLHQHITVPTRGRGTNEPSLLDLFFTSNPDSVDNIEICAPLGKSDHSLIKVCYRCQPMPIPPKIVRDYEKADFAKMASMLNINWEDTFKDCNEDINAMWEIFMERYNAAEEMCVPKKVLKTRKKGLNALLDRKALATRKKKYRLWKRYLTTKDGEIYKEYCRCRNQVRRQTRKIVKANEKGIAAKVKTNSKMFWKYVNGRTKLRPAIPELYKTHKQNPLNMAKSDEDKAETLGRFFSSVYSKEPNWSWILDKENKPENRYEMEIEVTRSIVLEKLQKLNPNKSPGGDNMHPRVVHELSEVLSHPFQKIFQLSLKLGKIPNAWRLAKVTAIYKQKGNKHDAGNYRPISLTSIACRLMESIIRDSLLKFLKDNNLLSNRQFGFLGGRSTLLQLLIVVDKWSEILDRGGALDVIYCDFQKAFDTVPHRRLCDVLTYYGIKDPMLAWICDFLSNRKQQVAVNGKLSSEFDVPSGVPQGSVLGPLLFIIFINVLVENSDAENLYLFADDLKLFDEIKGEDDVENMQSNLDQLYDWTCYSMLKFHPGKCKVMRLTPPRTAGPSVNPFYSMDDLRLEIVDKEKDLGIIIDEKLTFEDHINSKVNKANSLTGMIRRTFSYFDETIFKQLFVSLVRPHLEYGAPIWNPHTKKMINLIENVQRRATKLVPGLRELSYEQRLRKLELPTLKYRRYRGDMIETYKLAHELNDTDVCHTFLKFNRSDASGHDLRGHNLQVQNCHHKGDTRKYSFRCRVSRQWNTLPDRIVNSPSMNVFKNRLDEFWKNENVYYCPDIDIQARTESRRTRFI